MLHQIHQRVEIPIRVSVRRKSHDLVFVQGHEKAEVQCDNSIENTDRMECRNLPQDVDSVLVTRGKRSTGELAHAVSDEDERLIKTAGIKRACSMREVVWDGDQFLFPVDLWKVLACHRDLGLPGIDFMVLTLQIGILGKEFLEGCIVESMRNAVDVTRLKSFRFEAITDRASGKTAGALDPIETLFRSCRTDPGVCYQCSGRVESLRDTQLPGSQVGEFACLEPNAVVETADTKDVHGQCQGSARLLTAPWNKLSGPYYKVSIQSRSSPAQTCWTGVGLPTGSADTFLGMLSVVPHCSRMGMLDRTTQFGVEVTGY